MVNSLHAGLFFMILFSSAEFFQFFFFQEFFHIYFFFNPFGTLRVSSRLDPDQDRQNLIWVQTLCKG